MDLFLHSNLNNKFKIMKKLSLILAIATMASCSGGSAKFVGTWKATGKYSSDHKIIIEQKEDRFNVYQQENPDRVLSFTYDKGQDILTANDGRDQIDIQYIDSSKQLTMGSRGRNQTLDLEKVKE